MSKKDFSFTQLNRETEDVLATVSHDLKTPLSVAKLTFDLIERDVEAGKTDIGHLLSRGQQSIKIMENLIGNLLDGASIESGNVDFKLVDDDLGEVVRLAVNIARPLAEQKSIQLVLGVDKSPCRALFDRERIQQVLLNILGNAIKFTAPGGEVIVQVQHKANDAVVMVLDTGCGIAEENLVLIFERFWRAPHARQMGSGLGLSIAKGIVNGHGGRIWAVSQLGQGSRFYFSLPAASK